MNQRKLAKKANARSTEKNPAFVAAVEFHKALRDQGVLFALDVEEDGNMIFKTNGPLTKEQGERLENTNAVDMIAAIIQYAFDNDKMMMVSPALFYHILTQTALDLI